MKTQTGPENSYCGQCGTPLQPQNKFCPRCGTEVTRILPPVAGFQPQTGPQAPTYSSQSKQTRGFDNRMWVVVFVIIVIVILILPVFPRTRIVYVNGTTQTVTNTTSFSTSLQVITQSTQSQVPVYTGSFQYFSNTNYYNYYGNNNWWNTGCYWLHGHIVCNYYNWYWYQPSYGQTVTVSASDNVVNVLRTQQGSSESLILVYSNGQQSQTYQNVYVDNLAPNGVSTMPGTVVVTNTIVNTIVNPVTQTVPCNQCVPMTVTDHVSILQLLFGF